MAVIVVAKRIFAIRESRMYNTAMILKPQDIVVALKLTGYSSRPPIARIASDLLMSPSEVHGAIKRLQAARLLHGSELHGRANLTNLEEFLIHGVKYAYPAKRGQPTRGVPTSYAAEPLKHFIVSDNEPIPVWPYAQGKARGIGFSPLYRSVPAAAIRDPILYQKLALVDALRDGKTRERKLAEEQLTMLLHETV